MAKTVEVQFQNYYVAKQPGHKAYITFISSSKFEESDRTIYFAEVRRIMDTETTKLIPFGAVLIKFMKESSSTPTVHPKCLDNCRMVIVLSP